MKHLIFLLSFLSVGVFNAEAQKKEKKDPWQSTDLWEPIPINRQLAHDKIDEAQKACDLIDGVADNKIFLFNNPTGSTKITDLLIKRIDQLQIILENQPMDHWKKTKYLGYLEKNLKAAKDDLAEAKSEPEYYQALLKNFEDIFKLQEKEEGSVAPFINNQFNKAMYGNLNMLKEDTLATYAVYKNMARRYPNEMVSKLDEFYFMPAAETLMASVARQKPNLILTYATSTSFERYPVRRSQDPLVKSIVQIADQAKSPLRALTFLDELNDKSMTLAQVNTITADNGLYYRNLIQKRTKANSYTKRMLDRESTLMALEYVRTMNELHDAQDPVRFKCIEPLNAREMYYLMVLCGDEIYTSTFVGTFNRMLVKMAPIKGDDFLNQLNLDKFRTFIRMCAGYNKLGEFLATMDVNRQNTLMASFVKNIEKNTDTDVEDAVDVADAFGSIQDENLLLYLRDEVKKEYERNYLQNNVRGLITYFLLHTLCTSIINPASNSDQLQAQLKVPPISFVPNKNLKGADGIVYQQVYFYGDDDGKSSYNNFIANYKSATDWKIEKNDKWVKISSLVGQPTVLFANLPLDEPEDEEAQKALLKYLDEQNIKPAIVIHRGHSYHLPLTLKHLSADDKIIILGSCGGYHNLSSILTSSEDAHIVSSKQTGTMLVTDPIINAVNKRIMAGQDINWVDLWAEVGTQMKSPGLQDKFNDYVPPHKNMGALYLKAFKIQMQENGLSF
ncbi:MAG: hypothetical protein FGM54_06340 [Chitinophagaceae bacterium]|nr:hypothetical protein [Chitinophagaceae bacterium]